MSSLRARAELLLRSGADEVTKMSAEEVQTLVHELNVHQIELEIQNEELRLAQLALADSRDRYSDLYEFAPVGYLTLDPTGLIRKANLTAARLIQVERENLIEAPLSEFMSSEDADLLYLHLFRVFANGRANVCDLQLVREDDAPCVVRLESVRVDESEPPVCWSIMSDITELTQAQQAAARRDRLSSLGTLAAGIAHEVNNPLWMISLKSQVALEAQHAPDGSQVVTDCLHEINELVTRGGQIVNGVLRFATQNTTQKWPHSLIDVLRQARDYTRESTEERNVTVQMQAPQDLPCISMNPTEMVQVFVNLLNNAVNASDPQGIVRINVRQEGDTVVAAIEDTGCGISPKESEKIFDPFYTSRRETGGTGLGLSIAHRIVEEHDGQIGIVSQLGRGTTITVCLPIATEYST